MIVEKYKPQIKRSNGHKVLLLLVILAGAAVCGMVTYRIYLLDGWRGVAIIALIWACLLSLFDAVTTYRS